MATSGGSGSAGFGHQRIDYVDGLRAVAVLAVVFLHSASNAVAFGGDALGTLQRHVVIAGTHGVDLFYVISGFCLSFPTLRKLYTTGRASFDIGEFFTRRIVRIFPPYWCAIGVALAFIAWHNRLGEPLTYGLYEPQSAGELARQFVLVRDRLWIEAVFWTLQIEFLWYLAFPICLALWLRAPLVFWIVAIAPHPIGWLLLKTSPHLAPYLPFWLMLLPFMLGITAADAFLRKPAWTRWALPAAIVLGAYGVAFNAMPKIYGGEGERGLWTHVQIAWQLASFAFVVAAGAQPWLMRALAARPMRAIGIASYSIYLVHALVVSLPVFHRHGWLMGLLGLAAGVAFGFAFWFAFERPVTETRLRDRLWGYVGAVVRPINAFLRLPTFTAPAHQPVPAS